MKVLRSAFSFELLLLCLLTLLTSFLGISMIFGEESLTPYLFTSASALGLLALVTSSADRPQWTLNTLYIYNIIWVIFIALSQPHLHVMTQELMILTTVLAVRVLLSTLSPLAQRSLGEQIK